ncbi:MAG: hypothetical protein LBJ61_02965, partial [Deltaproteobacteria bacterium]|nr:hypothetical protein [Deltaproteobacteria bacterium]
MVKIEAWADPPPPPAGTTTPAGQAASPAPAKPAAKSPAKPAAQAKPAAKPAANSPAKPAAKSPAKPKTPAKSKPKPPALTTAQAPAKPAEPTALATAENPNAPFLPVGVKPYPKDADADGILKSFLGIPFRVDGVVNDEGRWATWNRPDKTLPSPGFNCSGFLLEAVRHLANLGLTLSQAAFDRDDDSGPDSEMGLDWDYGLDALLNLTGAELDELLPAPKNGKLQPNEAGRPEGLGLDINGPDFPKLIQSLPPNGVYAFAISKPDRRFKGGLSYYHVGIVHADGAGNVWIYQCTARAGTHRLNLNNPGGIAAIRRYFPPIRAAERRFVLAKLNPARLSLIPPTPKATLAQSPDPEADPDAAKAPETLAKAAEAVTKGPEAMAKPIETTAKPIETT